MENEAVKQLTQFILSGAVIIPMINAIIGVVKQFKVFKRYSNWLPVIAAGVGVGFTLPLLGLSVPSGIAGIMLGLSAVGAYKGVKGLRDVNTPKE